MRRLLEWLFKSFLKGLLLVVPLMVTAWVFYFVFVKIDGLLRLDRPGLGFVITVAFIVAVGAVGSTFVVDRLMEYLEKAVGRVPVAKLIYFSLKDFVGAFVGEKKGFKIPVLVSPVAGDPDLKMLGFVTAEALNIPEAPDYVAVYLPQSYNIAGNLLLLPRDRVSPLPPGESAKWMAFIVSGGVSRGPGAEGARAAP